MTETAATYERRLVGFSDVLGWRSHVEDSLHDAKRLKFLRLMVESWSYHAKNDYSVGYGDLKVSSFSDNAVYSQDTSNPLALLARMAIMQLAAAGGGFWIRGGVTVGKIVHTRDCVFGPALNRAYEIECTVANYPRIVIDSIVIQEFGPLAEFVVEEQGVYFLDPFTPSFLEKMREAPDEAEWMRSLGAKKHMQSVGKYLRDDLSEAAKRREDKEAVKVVWLYMRLAKHFRTTEFSECFPLPDSRAP